MPESLQLQLLAGPPPVRSTTYIARRCLIIATANSNKAQASIWKQMTEFLDASQHIITYVTYILTMTAAYNGQ